MAKRKTNKSQLIRDALKAHRGKSPSEISAILKSQGYDIPPQYVSNVKVLLKRRRAKRKGMRVAKPTEGTGFAAVDAALALVKASGGLEGAKKALSTIEEIARGVGNG